MGATEAYITLDEAARLEGTTYNTMAQRATRGKLETKGSLFCYFPITVRLLPWRLFFFMPDASLHRVCAV